MPENAPVTKHERLENWLADFAGANGLGPALGEIEICLRGYVECFNRGQYYEAHDVLEHAWLRLPRTAPEWTLLKGMIQLAGGFVHLRLQYLEPTHRVHGRRLGPAGKLFALAAGNLAGGEVLAGRLGLELGELLALIQGYAPALDQPVNPWTPAALPVMALLD